MLQSPTNLFPDPSFRLQALVHGRSYLSPVQAPTSSQTPGGVIDPSAQYHGGGGMMYQSHHRLPHFSLALPPSEILHPYQPHVVASFSCSQPTGFHPGLVSSVRRAAASFQAAPAQPPPKPIESYSQTLFNLSHQTHHLPQAALAHSVGPLAHHQQSSVRPSPRAGPTAPAGTHHSDGAVIQDRSETFSLRGMPNYFEAECDGRLQGRGLVRELPLRPIGVSSQRVRHQLTPQAKHLVAAGEEGTTPVVHSYHLPHHHPQQPQNDHLMSRLPRISTPGRNATPTHNNNNNNDDDDDSNDKEAAKLLHPSRVAIPHSWKPSTLNSDEVPEVELFSFKDPNSVGVHHPSDRPPLRANPTRFSAHLGPLSSSSGGGVGSPSGCRVTSSPSSFSIYQGASSTTKESGSYHRHFLRGSVIQLASGQLKRVEDLRTEDFLDSCGISADLSVDMSRVTHVRMNHDTGCVIIGFAVGKKQIQVTVEAIVDHPFFVLNRGWSSCCPSRTLECYGLPCHQLTVGDICISLTHRYPNSPDPPTSPPPPTPSTVISPDRKGAASSSLQGGQPLLATVDPCPPVTPPGSVSSPPPHSEETDHRSGGDRVSRKRRWSAPDNAGKESSPIKTTPNVDRIPFKVTLTSVPSVAF